jgi:hypothetical protein
MAGPSPAMNGFGYILSLSPSYIKVALTPVSGNSVPKQRW